MAAPSIASGEQAPGASSPALATIAAAHAARKQADRQTILNVLDREEVRKVAKGAGVRVEKAAAAIATLDGAELAQLARQARDVEDALAGGGLVPSKGEVIGMIAVLLAYLFIKWLGSEAVKSPV